MGTSLDVGVDEFPCLIHQGTQSAEEFWGQESDTDSYVDDRSVCGPHGLGGGIPLTQGLT